MIAGLVLAAGAGVRFGGPKAPVVINSDRLVDHAVRCLRDGGCDPVLVVLGAWVGEVPAAQVVVNDEWATGMASSLRAGLADLHTRSDVTSVVVTLVDLPGMTGTAVRRIADADADGGIVVATYGGERGHPVRFDRPHWSGIVATLTGDEGARGYLSGRSDITFVEVGDVAHGYDLDEPIK